jgi:hypothetical protein
MKKILFYSIALLTACTMMIGCQPKNEPQNPEQPQDTTEVKPEVKPVAAVLDYSFEVTDEMQEVADFNITYYDKDGKLQTEQLTGKKWEKSIVAALPAKLGVKVNTVLKADFDPTKYETFTALRKYYYFAYVVDKDGKQVDEELPFSNSTGVDMTGDKIEAFMNKYKEGKGFLQVLYTFDEEGKKTYHSEWE